MKNKKNKKIKVGEFYYHTVCNHETKDILAHTCNSKKMYIDDLGQPLICLVISGLISSKEAQPIGDFFDDIGAFFDDSHCYKTIIINTLINNGGTKEHYYSKTYFEGNFVPLEEWDGIKEKMVILK